LPRVNSKKFNTGSLDTPVFLVFATNLVSASGSSYAGPKTKIRAWCKVHWLKGTELEVEKTSVSKQKVVFLTRFRKDITSLTQVEYLGDVYDVEDIRQKGRNMLTHIGCVKNE